MIDIDLGPEAYYRRQEWSTDGGPEMIATSQSAPRGDFATASAVRAVAMAAFAEGLKVRAVEDANGYVYVPLFANEVREQADEVRALFKPGGLSNRSWQFTPKAADDE